MGKKKFNNAYIPSRKSRFSSFTKRKSGLFSKARELSSVTNSSVLIICQSESHNFYWQATGPLKSQMEKLSSTIIEENRIPTSIIHGEKRGDEKTPGNLTNPLSVRQKRKLNKMMREKESKVHNQEQIECKNKDQDASSSNNQNESLHEIQNIFSSPSLSISNQTQSIENNKELTSSRIETDRIHKLNLKNVENLLKPRIIEPNMRKEFQMQLPSNMFQQQPLFGNQLQFKLSSDVRNNLLLDESRQNIQAPNPFSEAIRQLYKTSNDPMLQTRGRTIPNYTTHSSFRPNPTELANNAFNMRMYNQSNASDIYSNISQLADFTLPTSMHAIPNQSFGGITFNQHPLSQLQTSELLSSLGTSNPQGFLQDNLDIRNESFPLSIFPLNTPNMSQLASESFFMRNNMETQSGFGSPTQSIISNNPIQLQNSQSPMYTFPSNLANQLPNQQQSIPNNTSNRQLNVFANYENFANENTFLPTNLQFPQRDNSNIQELLSSDLGGLVRLFPPNQEKKRKSDKKNEKNDKSFEY